MSWRPANTGVGPPPSGDTTRGDRNAARRNTRVSAGQSYRIDTCQEPTIVPGRKPVADLPVAIVLVLATLSGLTTLIGVGLALSLGQSTRGTVIGIGFSTGIMLVIALFELIPEATTMTGIGPTAVAVGLGLGLVAVVDPLISHFHFVKEEGVYGENLKSAYLIAFGLILHDFPEGFAMANSYIHSPALGLLIALAIGLHNIPEEFAMCIPLIPLEDRRLLWQLAFLSGLSEPAGALVGLVAVGVVPALNPLFMAFAAGAMIYVSIHELFPMARQYERIQLFGLGLLLSLVAYVALQQLTATIAM